MMTRILLPILLLCVTALVGCSRSRAPASACGAPLRDVRIDFNGLEQATERQVFVDMTVARIPEKLLDGELGAYRPVPTSTHMGVPAEAAEAMVHRWNASKSVWVESAPKMLSLAGQKATLFIGESISFAKSKAETNEKGGLEFSVEENAGSPVSLGEHIALVADPSEDGSRIALAFEGTWSELEEGASVAALTEKGLPEFKKHVREQKIETTLNVENDAWTLFGDPQWIEGPKGRSLRFILMRAVVIEPGASPE
jgi:hypothetical protein